MDAGLISRRRRRWCAWLPLAVIGCLATAPAQSETLPQPLTLEYALAQADRNHPALARAEAALDLAHAERLSAEARRGVRVTAEGLLRWVEPSETAPVQDNEDHRASLFVRQTLHDFGRTRAAKRAADAAIVGSQWGVQATVAERRLTIMQHFFDVLLADLQFNRDNEAMATAFIRFDRLRERNEVGQVSDVTLFEAESGFRESRRRQQASQARQRLARARLAAALGLPDELPSELVRPAIDLWERELPPYEVLLEQALAQNTQLNALKAESAAAEQAVRFARAAGRPLLHGELEASAYSRELGSSDRLRAGVLLEVPLYTGNAVRAKTAAAQARWHAAQARERELAEQLRQEVLEAWLDIRTLRVRREAVWALEDYRELYLARSRAAYEMELRTDLGDAMVELSQTELEAARVDFELALAWERLDALTGAHSAPVAMERGGAEGPAERGEAS